MPASDCRQSSASTASLQTKLDLTLKAGDEDKAIDAVVGAARSYGELTKTGTNLEAARKENADLRGQVAFFKRRLEAKGGRDCPPCWATESGSPEYLFFIELAPTGVVVKPSWPPHREADAGAFPGIDAALQSPAAMDAFVKNV